MQTQKTPMNKVDEIGEWDLTTVQMFFLMQRHNPIQEAYTNDDMAYLDSIENAEDYRSLFGNMSFDEAMDRYECMLEDDSEDS